jgi:hypothetical protein
MPTSGPRFPSTVTSAIPSGEYNNRPWSNTSNATASNNSYAICSLVDGNVSDELRLTGYGFTIPTNSTISGITITLEGRSYDGAYIVTHSVQLLLDGSPVGNPLSNFQPPQQWNFIEDSTFTFGSSTSLWGRTWTAAEINATSFGVALRARSEGANAAWVDTVTITVAYTESSPESEPTVGFITLERAKQHCVGADSGHDALLNALILAVGSAIDRYCRRRFAHANYDELYDGDSTERLLLRHYPITAVHSVQYDPQPALEIRNTSGATQSATAQVLATGLRLVRITSSGTTNTTAGLTWTANPTVQSLATAINSLSAAGWEARVLPPFADARPDDLFVDLDPGNAAEGATVSCRNTWAALVLWRKTLSCCAFDPRGWLVHAGHAVDLHLPGGWLYGWEGPLRAWRVRYSAGYRTIPEDVQEACAQWVAWLWQQTRRDPSLRSQSSTTGTTASYQTYLDPRSPPPAVAGLLAPYRRRSV